METIAKRMNPWEHCEDCGALMLAVPGAAVCPHCGQMQLRRGSGRTSSGQRWLERVTCAQG